MKRCDRGKKEATLTMRGLKRSNIDNEGEGMEEQHYLVFMFFADLSSE